MQIKYLSQTHQTKAIYSIIDLFQGQNRQVSEYDSSRLSSLKHFIRDDNLQIMIMTIDNFKRANTILNQPQEGFSGSPKESLKKTNPILILDEPQNMESDLSKNSISELNPLFTLRFSATHKNYYNLLYSLNPQEALEQGLVKQIDVLALSENQTINDVYINVQKIEIDKTSKRPVATLELIVQNKDEFVKKSVKIKGNDSLKERTKNSIYNGFIVDEISFKDMFIVFENGLKLELNEINGKVKRQIQEQQITEALQLEYEAGGQSNGGAVNNLKNVVKSKLKKDFLEENIEFKELWAKIKAKTIFELTLDSAKYKESVIKRLENIEVREQKILKQFGSLRSDMNGHVEDERNFALNFEQSLPNIVHIIEKEIEISRKTIIEILSAVDLKQFIKNSDEYVKKAIESFDDAKHQVLLDKVVTKREI